MSVIHQSRRYAKFYYFDLEEDYSSITEVSNVFLRSEKFIENIFIDEMNRFKVKYTGMMSMLMWTEEPGHQVKMNLQYNAISGNHISNYLCGLDNVCLMETSTKFYVIPKGNKGTYKRLTKLPNYKMLGGTMLGNYAALFAEKIEIEETKPRSLRLLIYNFNTEFIIFALNIDIPENLDTLDWHKMVSLIFGNDKNEPPHILLASKLKVISTLGS